MTDNIYLQLLPVTKFATTVRTYKTR